MNTTLSKAGPKLDFIRKNWYEGQGLKKVGGRFAGNIEVLRHHYPAYYDEHNPPHLHAEHQGDKVLLDFRGNILRGALTSKTALRLIREWIDLHEAELHENWELARAGKDIKAITPLI